MLSAAPPLPARLAVVEQRPGYIASKLSSSSLPRPGLGFNPHLMWNGWNGVGPQSPGLRLQR